MHKEEVASRRTEGTILAYLRRREINPSTEQVFREYFNIFLQCDSFDPTMAPFISRNVGPSWFQRDFPAQLVTLIPPFPCLVQESHCNPKQSNL